MGKFRDTEPYKIDKNGTKYYHDYTCQRCGGNGIIPHFGHIDGGVCWECGGSGRSTDHPFKVYTPEYEKKLEEQRAKREAKRIAKMKDEAPERNAEILAKHGFNENGETFVILGNTFEIKDELKAAGCKFDYVLGWHSPKMLDGHNLLKLTAEDVFEKNAIDTYIQTTERDADVMDKIKAANDELARRNDTSEYIGEIGKRMELTLTLERRTWFETESYAGYGMTTTWIHCFKDEHGNVLVWKTSNCLDIEEGETIKCKATIKDHSVYRNKKQTLITRLKVLD